MALLLECMLKCAPILIDNAVLPTAEAIKVLEQGLKDTNAIPQVTC
jgi:hypothetical protein